MLFVRRELCAWQRKKGGRRGDLKVRSGDLNWGQKQTVLERQ